MEHDDIAINGNYWFLSTYYGVFRSADKGGTWVEIDSGFFGGGYRLAVAGDSVLYVNTGEYLYMSEDNGSHWTQVLEATGGDGISIKSLYVFGSTVICTIIDLNSDTQYICHSPDRGNNWIKTVVSMKPDFFYGNESSLFFVAAGCMYQLNDSGSGRSWQPVGSCVDIRSMVIFDGAFFAATASRGVCVSRNNGVDWTEMNNGLVNSDIVGIAVKNSTLTIAKRIGNSIEHLMQSMDGGNRWEKVPFAFEQIMSFAGNNGRMLVKTIGQGTKVFHSPDNGATWSMVANNLNSMTIHPAFENFNCIAMHGDTTVSAEYTTNGKIWRTADGGRTWDSLMSYPGARAYCNVYVGNRLFSASGEGNFFMSDDNGTTWRKSASPPNARFINCFAGNDPVYYAASADSGVYVSNDAGNTWKWCAGGPGFGRKVTSMAVYGHDCFVGMTNITETSAQTRDWSLPAIVYTPDGGATWNRVDSGLMNNDIVSLVVCNNRLFAGTNGNGVWYRPLSEMTAVDNPQHPARHAKSTNLVIEAYRCNREGGSLSFVLPRSGRVTVQLCSMTGQTVATLFDWNKNAGRANVHWSARGITPGLYVVKITTPLCSIAGRMMMIR